MLGKQFGGLRVLQKAGAKNKNVIYIVECKYCFTQYELAAKHILTNKYGCSDCYNRQRTKGCLSPSWKGGLYISREFFTNVQRNARRRNISFDITLTYLDKLWERQQGQCVYTGLDLVIGETASLDRVDSGQGYIRGNVQFVHKVANCMKWDLTEKEFYKYIDLMWRKMYV